MKIITSVNGAVSPFHPVQGLWDLKGAGFEQVMLDFNLFYGMENPPLGYDGFVEVLEESGLKPRAVRLSWLYSMARRTDLEEETDKPVIRELEHCEALGCPCVIAPPLFVDEQPGQEWEVNRAYYMELAAACKKHGTKILLTNQCRNVNGHLVRGICAEAEEAVEWVTALNAQAGEERFGFCLDAGVCLLCGQDMRELVQTLGTVLKAVIVRENNGQEDRNLLPFTSLSGGAANWLDLVRGLRDTCFDGDLILEYGCTAGTFSPLLRESVLALAKQVGDYFVWQISLENSLKRFDSIVLFGAGNMCRNYMKNYGEKYPPLFTCDNDRNRWGEQFCGLEIRPPEALRDLPQNCGVFICNIYYREIERQLRGLGVKNIEYFSDEYMPSFHEKRLEMR